MATLHIIGAKGNIGSRLVEETEGKYDIRKVVSPARSHLFTVDSGYYVLNLADDLHAYNFDTLKEGDTVAFTAAISEPSVCAKQFDLAVKVNVESTGEFIQQALDRGCKVIFLSSDVVYGRVEEEFDESQPLDPLGVYAEMKAIVEKRFIGHSRFKVLRLSYNFFKDDRFTTYLRTCASEDTLADLFDPFGRSIVHRDDTVDAIISLYNNWDVCEEGVINCGGPETLSRVEFAEILSELVVQDLITKVTTPDAKFYEDRPAIVAMRSPLLEKVLGRPARSMRDAITMEFKDGN